LTGDVAVETSASSAISTSFQGTETDSIQDEVISATVVETSQLESRLQAIERAIDRLYRLSLVIRQPSRYTLRDDEGNDINESFAAFARHLVDHRFPAAPEFLRARLSYGIVIRRKRFLYRQSHQRKLNGISPSKENIQKYSVVVNSTAEVQSTVGASQVTDLHTQGKTSVPGMPRPRAFAPSHTSASAIPTQPLPLTTTLEDATSVLSTGSTAMYSTNTPSCLSSNQKLFVGGM
jgi:hypothetical protein